MLRDRMSWSPPVSSVYGILQARVLQWIAMPFSRGSSWFRDWTWVACIAGRVFTIWASGGSDDLLSLTNYTFIQPTRSGSVSCEVPVPFPWVLVHARFCLWPRRVESLFPPFLWKSCNEIPLAFKVKFPGDSLSLCWMPWLGIQRGIWPGTQNLRSSGRTSLILIVLQFVGHPPSGYGIWFYHDCAPPTISLWLLLCLWTWIIFFLMASSVFLSMVVQQLVATLVASRREMSARPSTPPAWTNAYL